MLCVSWGGCPEEAGWKRGPYAKEKAAGTPGWRRGGGTLTAFRWIHRRLPLPLERSLRNPALVARRTPHRFRPKTPESASPPGEGKERRPLEDIDIAYPFLGLRKGLLGEGEKRRAGGWEGGTAGRWGGRRDLKTLTPALSHGEREQEPPCIRERGAFCEGLRGEGERAAAALGVWGLTGGGGGGTLSADRILLCIVRSGARPRENREGGANPPR